MREWLAVGVGARKVSGWVWYAKKDEGAELDEYYIQLNERDEPRVLEKVRGGRRRGLRKKYAFIYRGS